MTKVSVIIATRNEEKNIGRCLRSIQKQDIGGQIIVIDNYSTDNTAKIARKYTNFVYQIGPERTKQRNFGLKKARGDYVLLIDADMELEEDLIGKCLKVMSDSKTFGVVIDEISVGESFLAKIKALEKQLYTGHVEMEAARFFRKKDLMRIGGYDENLISGEDWDLSQRVQKLGRLGRVKKHIFHHEDQSWWQDIAKKYYYAKNIQRYAKKHPGDFAKQFNPINRLSILMNKSDLILERPIEAVGLIILKSLHFTAYLLAQL